LGFYGLAVSAEGTLTYIVGRAAGTASIEVVWVGRDGSVQGLTPPLLLTPPKFYGLALSPDATRLALDVASGKSSDVWIKQLPSGPFTRLTFDGAANRRPSWVSDGRSVLFISERGAVGNPAPWRQRADGSAPAERLTTGSTLPIWAAVLSRDGEWLVYHGASDSSGWDIRAIRPGRDSGAVPLLTSPFDELAPSLSPDGRWLAYISNESGRNEVYVRPFPNVETGRWQISTGGGEAPRWAHSGRELFYQGGSNEMMVANVTLTPSFAAGTPHKLFDAIPQLYPSAWVPYYDVTPDDRRFIMARLISTGQKPGAAQLVMVENFRDEVRRKLAAAGQ
jgi:serine/threonine-protein kinase